MGNWTMVVEGHGIHDNGKPEDADAMLRNFAGDLRIAGHVVSRVQITTGAAKDLPVSNTGSVEAPPGEWRPVI